MKATSSHIFPLFVLLTVTSFFILAVSRGFLWMGTEWILANLFGLFTFSVTFAFIGTLCLMVSLARLAFPSRNLAAALFAVVVYALWFLVWVQSGSSLLLSILTLVAVAMVPLSRLAMVDYFAPRLIAAAVLTYVTTSVPLLMIGSAPKAINNLPFGFLVSEWKFIHFLIYELPLFCIFGAAYVARVDYAESEDSESMTAP